MTVGDAATHRVLRRALIALLQAAFICTQAEAHDPADFSGPPLPLGMQNFDQWIGAKFQEYVPDDPGSSGWEYLHPGLDVWTENLEGTETSHALYALYPLGEPM